MYSTHDYELAQLVHVQDLIRQEELEYDISAHQMVEMELPLLPVDAKVSL